MKQIIQGSTSQPRLDYLSMKRALEEADAQSEALRVLGNAIRQHRELLEQRDDFVARIELMIPRR